MKQKKKSDIAALLDYAGSHKGLTFLGLGLSAVSMVFSMSALPLHLAGGTGPDRGSAGLDGGPERRHNTAGWPCFCGGRYPSTFGIDVYPFGRIPHSGQHPQAGHGPCDARRRWATLTPMPPG